MSEGEIVVGIDIGSGAGDSDLDIATVVGRDGYAANAEDRPAGGLDEGRAGEEVDLRPRGLVPAGNHALVAVAPGAHRSNSRKGVAATDGSWLPSRPPM